MENIQEFKNGTITNIPSAFNDYKEYLSSTDWYYTRQLETGEEVPEDVVTKRTKARAYIREVEDGK